MLAWINWHLRWVGLAFDYIKIIYNARTYMNNYKNIFIIFTFQFSSINPLNKAVELSYHFRVQFDMSNYMILLPNYMFQKIYTWIHTIILVGIRGASMSRSYQKPK